MVQFADLVGINTHAIQISFASMATPQAERLNEKIEMSGFLFA